MKQLNSWKGFLFLRFKYKNKKTYLHTKKNFGPLFVQNTFYPEDKICHVYILHPPGGLVGGDNLYIKNYLEEKSKVLVTTPSASKFYKSNGKIVNVKYKIFLEKNTTLEWLPQNNIFFSNSLVNIENEFFIKSESKLIIWDTLCLNNLLNKKKNNKSILISSLKIWKKNVILLNEKIRIIKGNLSILFNKKILSMLIAMPADINILKFIRKFNNINKNIIIGSTLIKDILIIRIIGNDNILIQKIMKNMWKKLRIKIIGIKPCIPRIWFT